MKVVIIKAFHVFCLCEFLQQGLGIFSKDFTVLRSATPLDHVDHTAQSKEALMIRRSRCTAKLLREFRIDCVSSLLSLLLMCLTPGSNLI